MGQKVAGQLLDGERVERLVMVEGVDDVVAVGEDPLALVAVVADRIREPRQIEPRDGHALAVVGRVEQAVDQMFIGLGVVVLLEGADLIGRGRDADQVERQPTDQRASGGFGRRFDPLRIERGEDESVDRIAPQSARSTFGGVCLVGAT